MPNVKRSSAKSKSLAALLEHSDPEVRALAATLAAPALKPWTAGVAPSGRARATAVRQLIADARAPFAVVRRNPKSAAVIAGWLAQRVHELGLAATRTDVTKNPDEHVLTFAQIVRVDPLRSAAARFARALLDLAERGERSKTYETETALEALVSCGVLRKSARNWIDAAESKDLGVKPDERALGRFPRVEAETANGRPTGRTRITL